MGAEDRSLIVRDPPERAAARLFPPFALRHRGTASSRLEAMRGYAWASAARRTERPLCLDTIV